MKKSGSTTYNTICEAQFRFFDSYATRKSART